MCAELCCVSRGVGLKQSLQILSEVCSQSKVLLTCMRRYAYVITCTNVVKEGEKVVEVHAEGRKVKDDEKPPKVSQAVFHPCAACSPFLLLTGPSVIVGQG